MRRKNCGRHGPTTITESRLRALNDTESRLRALDDAESRLRALDETNRVAPTGTR